MEVQDHNVQEIEVHSVRDQMKNVTDTIEIDSEDQDLLREEEIHPALQDGKQDGNIGSAEVKNPNDIHFLR